MAEFALKFSDSEKLGKVVGVDTSRVFVEVDDHSLLTRTAVGNLLAIRGQTQHEYLISIIERVTRGSSDDIGIIDPEIDENVDEFTPVLNDSVRAILIGTYRTVDGSKRDTFKRGADSFPQVDREAFLISASNLQNLMGLLAKEVKDDERLSLGKFATDGVSQVIANGDKFFQRHAAILGSTGSGKSWAVSLILERAQKLKHPNIVVFDLHGEYKPLADKAGGGYAERYKVAGPSELIESEPNTLFLPYWLLTRDEMLSMLLDRTDSNAPNQASRFTLHVRNLKRDLLTSLSKSDVLSTFTVDSPIPYQLDELLKLLISDNNEKVPGAKTGTTKQGDWFGKLSRFISRLEAKISDRRYGFMFQPPTECVDYDWLPKLATKLLSSGIKVIDFSEVPPDILPVVTGLLMRTLYDVQFWMNPEDRTPISFICDEAHLYLPVKNEADSVERKALEAFERVAKEGRKYGVGLVVVSQRPSDVSKTILSQCNNFLVLRLTNNEDQSVVRHLIPDSLGGITQLLPLLDVGESILLGDAILLPSRIRLDKPTVEPASSTRDFWKEWSALESNSESIERGVENLRLQSR